MAVTQGSRIRFFPSVYSGLCVGHEARGSSVRDTHRCDRGVWPRRKAYRQADPDRFAVRRDRTIGGAPARAQRDGSHSRLHLKGGFRTRSGSGMKASLCRLLGPMATLSRDEWGAMTLRANRGRLGIGDGLW